MAGGKSLEERSESGSIERSSHETPAGVKRFKQVVEARSAMKRLQESNFKQVKSR